MADHMTEAMIEAEAADSVATATDEDVQGYDWLRDLMTPPIILAAQGYIAPLIPHTATAVPSGGSSGGSLEVPTKLN